MMRILCSLGIFALTVSSLALSQQCTTYVAVNAFDSRTKADLHGLTARDFEARTGKASLPVVSIRPLFRNRVLVLVDASATDNASARNAALESIADFVREAPPGMPIAFGVFGERAVFTNGFLTDQESLDTGLQHVLAQSNSLGPRPGLFAALRQGLAMFRKHQAGDTILLLSNGADHLSAGRTSELAKEFLHNGARLQLLVTMRPGLPSGPSSILSISDRLDHVSDSLIRLANRTGGVLMGFMNSDWFDLASSGYLLGISTSARKDKPRSWKLKIRDSAEEASQADIFYPEQLSPCSTTMVAAMRFK